MQESPSKFLVCHNSWKKKFVLWFAWLGKRDYNWSPYPTTLQESSLLFFVCDKSTWTKNPISHFKNVASLGFQQTIWTIGIINCTRKCAWYTSNQNGIDKEFWVGIWQLRNVDRDTNGKIKVAILPSNYSPLPPFRQIVAKLRQFGGASLNQLHNSSPLLA